jgi:acetyl esterase/lipase
MKAGRPIQFLLRIVITLLLLTCPLLQEELSAQEGVVTETGIVYGNGGDTLKEVPEQYERASPVNYVRRDSPPILILHGDKDDEVPLEQAKLLNEKMKEVGAVHMLIIRPCGTSSIRI